MYKSTREGKAACRDKVESTKAERNQVSPGTCWLGGTERQLSSPHAELFLTRGIQAHTLTLMISGFRSHVSARNKNGDMKSQMYAL